MDEYSAAPPSDLRDEMPFVAEYYGEFRAPNGLSYGKSPEEKSPGFASHEIHEPLLVDDDRPT